MLGPRGRFQKECKPRELRELCHQSFWCDEERAHAINLSHGGMCFRMSRRAEPGEVVTLHHGPAMSVQARIAWTRRLDTCTEVGVQFLGENSRVQEWLSFLRVPASETSESESREPVLALPAPGQTYRPVSHCLTPRSSGTSWKAAMHLLAKR